MSDKEKKPWDRIPSVNLEVDEGHPEIIKPKRERIYPRTDLASLNKILEQKVSYLPVKLASAANGQCKGMILDFSENGCRLAVTVPLQKGELVKVGFVVKKRTIVSKAVVKWISRQSQVYLIGMEFQGLPDEGKEFLRAIGAIAMLDTVEISKMKEFLR